MINDLNQVLNERYQNSEKIQLFLKETVDWLVQDVFSAMEDFYSSDSIKSIDDSDKAKQRFVDYVNNRRIQLQSNYRMLWSVLKIMLNDRLDSLTEFVGVCCGVGSDEYVLVKFFLHKLRYEFLDYDLFYLVHAHQYQSKLLHKHPHRAIPHTFAHAYVEKFQKLLDHDQ